MIVLHARKNNLVIAYFELSLKCRFKMVLTESIRFIPMPLFYPQIKDEFKCFCQSQFGTIYLIS